VTTKEKGNYFEKQAIEYLINNNFTILETNFYAKKLGEIDIIAIKDNIYHFIEVKSGKNFEAIYNITPTKLHKLYKSINYYIKIKNLDITYSVDAIVFANNNLEFLENISL